MPRGQPQRGEIWVVNLDPTIGSEIQKARPAVVVNAHIFDLVDTRIVVPLTTWQSRFANQTNKVHIPRSEQNDLDSDSAADFLQVRCVSTQRFVRRVGTLEPDLLDEIVAGIAIAIDYQP
jgi:mRNA interferase MazF